MRIAFVTTEEPWPAWHGGRRRTVSQLSLLRDFAEVDVYAVSKAHPVHVWRSPRHVPHVLRMRLRGLPYLVAKWDSPAMHARLQNVACDVAYLDHLGAAAYLRHFNGKRVVLEEHNVESDVLLRWGERQRGPARVAAMWEAAVTRRYEAEVRAQVDAVVTLSPHAPGTYVPMWVEPRARHAPAGRRVCFVGTASWHPNRQGLRWFHARVWPRVLAAVPDAIFEQNRPEARDEEIASLYDRSRVLVAPAFGGSGMSVKVLDGLAAGMPVVTTHARGFVSADAMCVSDDPHIFAEHLIRLLRDDEACRSLSVAGRAFVEAHHSRAVAAEALRRVL